ncbi:MAG: ABC transporter permease [Planctomycetota bacterium]
MAAPKKTGTDRTALDPARLEKLLAEAAEFKGESLWQDAWRRLKRNRGAYLSLWFLALFGLTSFLAPLLPLASPSALNLQIEPQPSRWPWAPSPKIDRATSPDAEAPAAFGEVATRSVGSLLDDGWQHRTFVDFTVPGEGPDRPTHFEGTPALAEIVRRASGREPLAFHKRSDTPGVHVERYAVVHRFADKPEKEGDVGLQDAVEEELAAARARGDLDTGAGPVELAGLEYLPGLWPDMPFFDRWMLGVRSWLFGFWEVGPLLGTDAKGRDILARIVWGSRISIQVSVIASLVSLLLGVTYGAFSGFLGGRVDNLMMRIVDVLYSIPFIFVVIFFITVLNAYRTDLEKINITRMTIFYLVIGAIYWLTMARVVRGQVLSLKNQEFVEAARVVGAGTARIVFVHIVPNVLSIVIVYLTLTIPAVMLFEAFLSFLGLGVEAPRVSWGLLAVDGSEAYSPIKTYWNVIVYPAIAMASTLLALNILGDGLRDALDPKMRGKD